MRQAIFCSAFGVLAYLSVSQSASAQVSRYHACQGQNPASNEVFVYQHANYGGTCAALYAGWYPDAGTGSHGFGLANDSLTSFKAGSGVFVKLFWDNVYRGEYWYAGTYWGLQCGTGYLPNIAAKPQPPCEYTDWWNDKVSSIKVVPVDRSVTCNDLRPGEFALFTQAAGGASWWSDCVVLKYPTEPGASVKNFSEPIYMGIENDAVVYVDGGPPISVGSKCDFYGYGGRYTVTLYEAGNYGGASFTFWPGQSGYLTNIGGSAVNKKASSAVARVSCTIG